MTSLLIVDDNEQNRYLLHALFTGHGYSVVVAENGAEALDKARENLPDLLITDILMPKMDGYTLCRLWKSDDTFRQVPLVFYTGTYTDSKDMQLALDMGADRFVLKPQEPEVLLAMVNEVIGTGTTGQTVSQAPTPLEDEVYFKEYNAALIRKLEDKLEELELVNSRLKAEIEERARAATALAESEERFRTFFEGAPIGKSMVAPDGRILEANHALADMCGRERRDLRSLTLWDIIHCEKPEHYDHVTRLLDCATGGWDADARLLRKDGRRLWVHTRTRLLRDPHGTPLYFLVHILDITQRRRSEQLGETRLRLIDHAFDHAHDDFLRRALDEICEVSDSAVGFCHFVNEDQNTLSLGQWSTEATPEFRERQSEDARLPLTRTGLWADCAKQRVPVVSGTHAVSDCGADAPCAPTPPESRYLVVPILRKDRLVAILGVGARSAGYDEEDVKTISFLADIVWTIVENKRAEDALVAAHERLRRFVDANIVGVVIADQAGPIVEANDYYLTVAGMTREELIAGRLTWNGQTPPEWQAADNRARRELEEHGTCAAYEKEIWRPDQSRVSVLVTATLLPGPDRQMAAFVLDLTERKNLEGQLRQSQKLEAVGQLAGGVAHDFNNILQAILGYSSLLVDRLPQGSELCEFAIEITGAAERAATLTRQLLALSRRQVLEMRYLDLNTVIDGVTKMIRRLIGADIEVRIVKGASLAAVRADCGQMEQVLLNLCINARDAMAQGGNLVVETENVTIDETYCVLHPWAQPGQYALLSVSDNGCGMDSQTLEHIFEPFFTTKEPGRGTGLGLATVYGIVRQHQGMIQVYSEVGVGTTFRIYLPSLNAAAVSPAQILDAQAPGGTETILVAEDDSTLRKLTSRVLEAAGYSVLLAADGEEALRILADNEGRVDLMLLDLIMPKMGGKAVYSAMQERSARPKFLFSSGYSANAFAAGSVLDTGFELLQKPYAPNTLLRRIREVLDSVSRP